MIRVFLFTVASFVLAANTFAQGQDILDFALKNPQRSQVQTPDRTWRIPKYGDYNLEKAVEQLKKYKQPFTVPKVIAWYSKTKDAKTRASFLYVLAASRDARAAIILGNALYEEHSLEVRFAAVDGLHGYFINFVVSGGSEEQYANAEQWWKKNRERLQKEADILNQTAH